MIRFGIVGAGNIASKFARDILFVEDAKLSAIASRDLERANSFKEKYNLEKAYGSYEEMANDKDIDAVYIATPHNFHMEQAILFLNHKKHVLCEKPIAVNTKQLDKMIQAAKDNHVLLMEAMWSKFLPTLRHSKRLIEERKLGKLLHIRLAFGYSLIENYDKERRLLNPHLAGGSLLDIGVYPISVLRFYNKQDIQELTAKATFNETGVDETVVMNFTFVDGSTAHLVSSINSNLSEPGKLVFENGTILLEDFSRCQEFTMNDEFYHIPYLGEGFVHQIQSFVNTIDKGLIENARMPHSDSRDVSIIMDQVREIIGLVYPFEQ